MSSNSVVPNDNGVGLPLHADLIVSASINVVKQESKDRIWSELNL